MADTQVEQRNPKYVRFGLEVPKVLTYHGWEPGGEYTKGLTIRNVQVKTQKIRYKVSGDQFFSAVYPQPVTLSAGTSYTLPVTFRPIKKNPYEEFVEIRTADGEFKIPIRALVPKPTLSIPEYLKFGMCAVQDMVTINFNICNTSILPADFNWEVPQGFGIRPKSGSLLPKQSIKLEAMFLPHSALVYNSIATCYYGNSDDRPSAKQMRLEGVGKYPHLLARPVLPGAPLEKGRAEELNEPFAETSLVVKFGHVSVGSTLERSVDIVNMSAVSSKFSLALLGTVPLCDLAFASSESEGTVPPGGTHRVKLMLTPSLASPYPLFGYFKLRAVGGLGSCVITCIGQADGPKVRVEESSISFGNIECGKEATSILHIWNDSSVSTVFQLQLEHSGIFHADMSSGEIGPKASRTIIIHFTPRRPIPYYRRVACLVHYQEPCFFDLIGTGFTEIVRPVSLQAGCILKYLSHAQRGLTCYPPEQLKEFIDGGKLVVCSDGSLLPKPEFENSFPQHLSLAVPIGSSGYHHYMHSEMDPSGLQHVCLDVQTLKFGYCSAHHVSENRVRKGSKSHKPHQWNRHMCLDDKYEGDWKKGSWQDTSEPFRVTPEERDIPAKTTASFTILFKPHSSNQLFMKQLECFVFYKALRDYRQVDPLTITPSWYLAIQASGHTIGPSSETFVPKVSFDSTNVVFPPTLSGNIACRTVVLRNNGDMPVLFDFCDDETSGFTVKPSHGLLQDSYQVFVLQLKPPEAKMHKHFLKCTFNGSEDFNEKLFLLGTGESPSIELDNDGQLFFKPTCIGTSTMCTYQVTNTSRLPVKIEWRIPEGFQDVFKVDPCSSIVQPGEIKKHQWTFCPIAKQLYAVRAPIHAVHACTVDQSCTARFRSILSLRGEGCIGEMKCSPGHVDCPVMTVGTSWNCILTLWNVSMCTLFFRVFVEQEAVSKSSDEDEATKSLAENSKNGFITLSAESGVVQAHSQLLLRVTVRPTCKVSGQWAVKYELTDPCGGRLGEMTLCPLNAVGTLCTLSMTAAYPMLHVQDVQGAGVARTLTKNMLWSMLSIDQLNCLLKQEPSVEELRYAIGTRHSMSRRIPVRTSAILDFDFGAAPVGNDNEESSFHLVFENHGIVPAEWAFQFPVDVLLEPEYWADTGELDDDEKHELSVMDNDVFAISPKEGKLMPGDQVVVSCRFRHNTIGSSRLPVLLKINRGREVLLRWFGMTLERGQPFVHFVSYSHRFSSLPAGLQVYPKQDYELYNAGDSTVSFELDTEPFEALKHANYEMPIMECLQPRGEIPPKTVVNIGFVFSPLEARVYTMDVPVIFSNGDMKLITFVGEGYLPSECAPGTPFHCQFTEMVTGEQTAHLSQTHVMFGDVLLFSVVRRVVFLSNATDHTLSFNWELDTTISEVLTIQPGQGYLQPKQSVACKLTLYSHLDPEIYDREIVCRVLDESKMALYKLELARWEQAEEEKQHTFLITDSLNKIPVQNIQTQGMRPQTIPKLKTVEKNRPFSSSSELRGQFKTLPPIGCPSEETYDEWKKKDLAIRSKHRPRHKKVADSQHPQPPQTAVLVLRVTAQTHSSQDYSKLFQNIENFFVDFESDTAALIGAQKINVQTEESTIVKIILNQMIRDLLEDSNFLSAVQRVVNEPIPYFHQFVPTKNLNEELIQSAHTHTYAAGLETLPLVEEIETVSKLSQTMAFISSPSSSSESGKVSPASSKLALEYVIPHHSSTKDHLESHIKLLPEFDNFVESIVENTLLNILKEANSGELNISGPLYLIAKPPLDSMDSAASKDA